MAEQTVEIRIRVNSDQAKQSLAQLAAEGTKLEGSLKGVGSGAKQANIGIKEIAVGTALGQAAYKALAEAAKLAAWGIKEIVGIGRQAVTAAAEHQRQEVLLAATLRATGQYSRAYLDDLTALAKAQMRMTTFSDEAVLAVERQLVTFGASRKEIMLLTPAVLALATGTGRDLSQSAFLVGKALDGQTMALRRAGIVIGDNVKASERADVIFQKIASRYPSATAAANTYAGAMAQLGIAYEKLLESAGNMVVENGDVIAILHALRDEFFKATDGVDAASEDIKNFVTDALLFLIDTAPLVVDALGMIGSAIATVTRTKLYFDFSAARAEFENLREAVQNPLSFKGVDTAKLNDALAESANRYAAASTALEKFDEGTARAASAQDHLRDRIVAAGTASHKAESDNRADVAVLRELAASADDGGEGFARFRVAVMNYTDAGGKLPRDLESVASHLRLVAGETDNTAGRQHAAGKAAEEHAKKIQDLIETTQEEIATTQAETRIIEEGIAKGQSYAEIEARLSVAKTLGKAATLGATDAIRKEADALVANKVAQIDANDAKEKAKAKLDYSKEVQKNIESLQAEIAAFKDAHAAGLDGAAALDAVAVALAKQKGATDESAHSVVSLTREMENLKLVEDAAKSAIEDTKATEAEIAILKQWQQGLLDVADARIKLSVAEATKGNATTPEQQADLEKAAKVREEAKKLRAAFDDSTFNIGKDISDMVGKVAEGIALGTNKGVSAMQMMKQAGEALWAKMLGNMIASKLGFDQEISKNFLRDIPGIINQGISLISGAWSGNLGQMAGATAQQANAGGGGSNIASNLVSIAGLAKAAYGYVGGLFGAGVGGAVPAGVSMGAAGAMTPAEIAMAYPSAVGPFAGAAGPTAATSVEAPAGVAMSTVATVAGIAAGVIGNIMTGFAMANYAGGAGKRALGTDQFWSGMDKAINSAVPLINTIIGASHFISGAMNPNANAPDRALAGVLTLGMSEFGRWMGFGMKGPTAGTAVRGRFEDWIEGPKAGVPYFQANSGTFQRGIGQEGARAWAAANPDMYAANAAAAQAQYPTAAGIPFREALKGYIADQQKSIGLTDKQMQQFTGLGAAFRAALGGAAGDEAGRSLAIVADMIGSLTKAGVGAEEAMAAVAKGIENLGPPTDVFRNLAKAQKDGLIVTEDYKNAVEGLAQVYFKDVPLGVRVAEEAAKEFAATGEVQFEALAKRISDVSAAAQIIAPALQDVFKSAIMDKGASAQQLGTQAFDAIENSLKDAVAKAFGDGIIQAGLDASVLAPFIATMGETLKKLAAGDITQADASGILKDALGQARTSLESLRPFIAELVTAGKDMASVFAEADNTVVGLATAIVQLQEAQETWNASMDSRIYALRNQGQTSPEIIGRPLPTIQAEFIATQGKYFGPGAANMGYSADERMAALEAMRGQMEQYLAIQIQAIEAQRDAAIAASQERIAGLQKERQAIQDAAAEAVRVRQEELDGLQEQLASMQAWKGVLDQSKSTLLSLRTGQLSPEAGGARLDVVRAEFARQRSIFEATGSTDAQRQAAAGQLGQLGPQILQMAAEAGIAQPSEQYRVLYDQIMGVLDNVAKVAGGKSSGLEATQARIETLQKEIKSIQKQSESDLRGIDASIKTEQSAITAAQDAAKAEIIRVSNNAAGVLEWIQGQGNLIFQEKQNELRDKLAALGVTDVSLESIGASSLTELQRIRALIEGQGSTVMDKGAFGLTSENQANIKSNIDKGLLDLSVLKSLRGRTTQDLAGVTGDLATYRDLINAVFPGIGGDPAQFGAVVQAIIAEIETGKYQAILGFGRGGVVDHEQMVRVAEGNRRELILPFDPSQRSAEAQRAFAALAMQEFTRAERGPAYGQPARAQGGPPSSSITIEKIEIRNENAVQIDAQLDLTKPENVRQLVRPALRELMVEGLSIEEVRARVAKIAKDRL